MLAPFVINAIDDALEAVPAQAPVLMVRQPEAYADLHHEIAKRVELCWQARVSESPPAQVALAYLAASRPSGERTLGEAIVDAPRSSRRVVMRRIVPPAPQPFRCTMGEARG